MPKISMGSASHGMHNKGEFPFDCDECKAELAEEPRPMTLEDWEHIQQGQRDAAEARAQALLKLGEELREDRSEWPVMYPLRKDGVELSGMGKPRHLSLAVHDIPTMAQFYIEFIETERTNRLCFCEWLVHPDDVDKPEGSRRVRKGAENPQCPVHTRLGFLLYFFEHYFKTRCPACPPDCRSCSFNPDCECYEHGNTYTDNHLVKAVQLTFPDVVDDPEITQDVMAKVAGLEDISGEFTGTWHSNVVTEDDPRLVYAPDCGLVDCELTDIKHYHVFEATLEATDGDEPESPTSRMEIVELPDGD